MKVAGKAVRLGFEDGEFTSMLYSVNSGIDAIEKLLRDNAELEPLRHERRRRRSARFWDSIRGFATSLFVSIQWECTCHSEHVANLRLQMRKRDDVEIEHSSSFNALFSFTRNVSDAGPIPWVWRQAEIQLSEIMTQ